MIRVFALFLGLLGPLSVLLSPAAASLSDQDPAAQDNSGRIVSGPPVDPRLKSAMERYRDFVVDQDEMLALKGFSFTLKEIVLARREGSEKAKQIVGRKYDLGIKIARSFDDWLLRVDLQNEGEEIVLVANAGGSLSFAVLNGALQGHPEYKRRAQNLAFRWTQFFLRWFNPDLPMFHPEYEGQGKAGNGRPIDRILLYLKNPQSGENLAAWRLSLDGSNGRPLSLETFSVLDFSIVERLDFIEFHEVQGIRIPKRCEFLSPQGEFISAMEFEDFSLAEIPAERFQKPE